MRVCRVKITCCLRTRSIHSKFKLSPSINDCRTASLVYCTVETVYGVQFPALSWLSSSPLGDIFQNAPNFEIEHTTRCGVIYALERARILFNRPKSALRYQQIPTMVESDIFSVMLYISPTQVRNRKGSDTDILEGSTDVYESLLPNRSRRESWFGPSRGRMNAINMKPDSLESCIRIPHPCLQWPR